MLLNQVSVGAFVLPTLATKNASNGLNPDCRCSGEPVMPAPCVNICVLPKPTQYVGLPFVVPSDSCHSVLK